MTNIDKLNQQIKILGQGIINLQNIVQAMQEPEPEQQTDYVRPEQNNVEPVNPDDRISRVIPWGAKVSEDFIRSLLWIEDQIGLPAEFLITAIALETNQTFSPSIRNPRSSATGLIQFMAATAKRLGTTTERLAQMNAVTQLGYVYRYFKSFGNDLSDWTLHDTYLAILWPAGIGKDDSHPIFVNDPKRANDVYDVNKVFDRNRDGIVSKAEVGALIDQYWEEGMQEGHCISWPVE